MKNTLVLSVALATLGGCVGDIGDPSRDGQADGVDPSSRSEIQASRIYRLTLRQYDRTLRDLVKVDAHPSAGFIADVGGSGFANNADLLGVSTQQASEFHQGAMETAASVMMESIDLLFPCPRASLGDDACARTFIEDFGERAFRRPLTAEEIARYVALHQQGRDDVDASMGVQIVIETMLQSPSFLFRSEVGDAAPGAVGELDPYEVATALSYYLWDSMPDDALFAQAASGALSQPDTVAAEVDRMIADPRSRDAIASFYEQLFEYDRAALLSRDAAAFPDFDAQLGSMVGELHAFVDFVVREQNGDVRELLSAPYSFVDANTAPLYGLAPPPSPGFARVSLDPAQRAGVLTQLGFLTIHATPVSSAPPRRGRFVVERLLCMQIASPPDNVPGIAPPNPGAAKTTRQTFAQHATDPTCAGCHAVLDPPGFALEHYDMLGRFRADENGVAVDASTSLDGLVGLEGAIDGGVELAQKLAESDAVRDCLVRQSFRFAFGRSDTPSDEAYLEEVGARFAEAGLRLQTLHTAIATSPRFRQRRFPQ